MAQKRLEFCKKGHLMSENRKIHPNGDTYCYSCKKERSDKSRKKYPEKHKEYSKKSRVKKMYGITLEMARDLFKKQNFRCAICNKKMLENKNWHIDHNHKTKEVRGILCHKCNSAIGLLEENKNIINSVLKYLFD